MKHKLILMLALLTLAFGSGAYAASKLTLVVNGVLSKAEPLLQNGTTYVPVRAAAELLGADVNWNPATRQVTIKSREAATLLFPADEYPQTAAHIASAIAGGESAVCTIDRSGTDDNRSASLAGIPTKSGYDRDEWPMAMCAEGGSGANIAYVASGDNRGAGAWVGNALEAYPNGTKVVFEILGVDTSGVQTIKSPAAAKPASAYKSCADVIAGGAAPLHKGDPGYSTALDRDGDGVACEQ